MLPSALPVEGHAGTSFSLPPLGFFFFRPGCHHPKVQHLYASRVNLYVPCDRPRPNSQLHVPLK